jgi:hypothetical protein
MVSLSRVALVLTTVYTISLQRKRFIVLVVCICATLFFFPVEFIVPSELLSRFDFFSNSSDKDLRGYGKILHNPEYLLLGASQKIQLYTGDTFMGQIHSNIFAMWFCYGLIGLLFQIYLVFALAKKSYVSALIYVLLALGFYFYQNIMYLILLAFVFDDKK